MYAVGKVNKDNYDHMNHMESYHMVSSPIVIITMIDNPPNEVSDNSGNTAQEVSSLTKAVRNAGDHEIERWTNEKTIA